MLTAIAVAASARVAIAGVAWDAPPECGNAAELAVRVAAQLGRSVGIDEVTARATVVADGGAYRATVQLGDDEARVLTGASCAEVTDAIALILALAIRDAPPPPPPSVLPQPPPSRRPGAPIELDLGAELGGDALLLPGPAVGVGAVLRIAREAWSARMSATIWDGQTAQERSAAATEVTLVSGQLGLCRRFGPGDGCVIGATGRMTGAGLVGADAATAARWWTAAGVRFGGGIPLGRRVVVGAGVDALVSLVRPRFVFDDGRDAYRTPMVTIRLGIVLTVRIFGGD